MFTPYDKLQVYASTLALFLDSYFTMVTKIRVEARSDFRPGGWLHSGRDAYSARSVTHFLLLSISGQGSMDLTSTTPFTSMNYVSVARRTLTK